jgi:hypothetical protein
MTEKDSVRWWSKVIPTEGCWHWIGYLSSRGYGRAWFERKQVAAHRAALKLLRGVDVPSGMEVDHLCRNRSCVNPDHLEVVDRRTNILRGLGACAANSRKTHCPRGHALSPDNLVPNLRYRACAVCKKAQSRALSRRRAEKRLSAKGVV